MSKWSPYIEDSTLEIRDKFVLYYTIKSQNVNQVSFI